MPIASTLTRAVVDVGPGMVNVSVPSFGVEAISTTGKVCPPSLLRVMRTFAQLTGGKLLLFTLQVISCVEPAGQLTLLFGETTSKGPEVAVVVTTISVKAVCPTLMGGVALYSELSRTVNLKFRVRDTELRASILAPASPPGNGPVTKSPAKMVDNLGNVLVGFMVAGKVNQFGPVSFVGLATLFAPVVVELSFCSQQ